MYIRQELEVSNMEELKIRPGFFIGRSGDGYFLYHADENLLYDIDELFYEVLKKSQTQSSEEIMKELAAAHYEEAVVNAIKEVNLQLEGGVLRNKRKFIESEYYLDIDAASLPDYAEKTIAFIKELFPAYYFQITFLNVTGERKFALIRSFIDELNSYAAGSPWIFAYNILTGPQGTVVEDCCKELADQNINLWLLLKDEKDAQALRTIDSNAYTSLIFETTQVNWEEVMLDHWQEGITFHINVDGMLYDLFTRGEEPHEELAVLAERLSKAGELFVDLSLSAGWPVRIQPFHDAFGILYGQQIKRFHCWAGQRKFYLSRGHIFPCQKLQQEREQLDTELFHISNEKQGKWYISDVDLQQQCLNCWAKGFCGGGCKALIGVTGFDRYCEIQKHLGKIYINNYLKLSPLMGS